MKLSVPRTTPKFNPIITPQTPLKTLTKSPDRIPTITCQVKFRPCIDIHKGKVKQIVGSTLSDEDRNGSGLVTNFVSEKSAAEYAELYREDGLVVGHVIMLGGDPLSRAAAAKALRAYPGGLQIGGGVTKDNAASYIDGGASHVTVTSYVFSNGQMDLDRLRGLVVSVGRNRIVLDLSCRKKDGRYAIVTNRWQKFSDVYLDEVSLAFLASYADEFLVHGVDVEGKRSTVSIRFPFPLPHNHAASDHHTTLVIALSISTLHQTNLRRPIHATTTSDVGVRVSRLARPCARFSDGDSITTSCG